ncbi:MAG: glycosyltransferase family 2 protein [Bacteroidales bacterium]
MLSICIPIYNFNVVKLVNELHNQATLLQINFEILCIDDCSDPDFKHQNKPIASLSHVNYIELNENIGRSKIRNLFLQYASFNYLLFLDCDALISSYLFIQNYIDAIKTDKQVVCGGLTYNKKKPARNFRLRWKYGIKKEVIPFEIRKSNPYKSFNTINFLINKSTFKQIQFDERINGYGHEDTLFGYKLRKNNITIVHINNPVINDSLEKNDEFIRKTEQAIENLIQINEMVNDPDFIKGITLLRTYDKLRKFHILFLVKVLFRIIKRTTRIVLISGCSCQNLFAFYKLGFLIQRINNN